MKDGHACALKVWDWCQLLSAHYDSSWQNGSSCSCTCAYTPSSFLPSLQTCVNTTSADRFAGCHSCFKGPSSALQTPVDLQTSGGKTTCISSKNYKSCELHGEFFDYNDFQPRWISMSDSIIFSLKKDNQKFFIEWKRDTAGKLSGRIIRLKFACSNKTGQAPIMTRCMLIKAQGNVTCKYLIA